MNTGLKFTLKLYLPITVLHVDIHLYENNTSLMNIFKTKLFVYFFFHKINYFGTKLLFVCKELKVLFLQSKERESNDIHDPAITHIILTFTLITFSLSLSHSLF